MFFPTYRWLRTAAARTRVAARGERRARTEGAAGPPMGDTPAVDSVVPSAAVRRKVGQNGCAGAGRARRSIRLSNDRNEADATIIAMAQRNFLVLFVVVAIGSIAIGLQVADAQNANYMVHILALPDHGQGNITMDYIAYDPKTGYVWVPAINIGSVDVVDTSKAASVRSRTSRQRNWKSKVANALRGRAAYPSATASCTSVTGPTPVYAPLMKGLSPAKPVATSIRRPTALCM
jgi:hypothetical protein